LKYKQLITTTITITNHNDQLQHSNIYIPAIYDHRRKE